MRFRSRVYLLFILWCLFGGLARAEDISPTLAQWDTVLDRAENFLDFRSRPDLQNELYERMAAYYGPDRFQRASFDKILEQLETLSREIPGFGEKLWAKRRTGKAFSVTYEPGQTSPYRLHQRAWIQRLDAQIEGYRSQAAGLLGLSGEARQAEIERRVNALQAEIETTQRQINALTDRAQQKIRREAFKEELRNRPELKELVAFAFHSRLTDHAFADPLRSGDADNVLETLRDIQNQYRETFRLPEFAGLPGIPAILRDMAREMAPNAQRLAADPTLFELVPGRGQETTTFYAVHRPLYAAFRGVPLEECVGGACNYLEHTTGKRHAVPVLDGVEVRFAEVEGRWTGFTEVVPVRNSETGRVYGSTLLGHTRFKTPVYVTDNTGHKTRTTLYELWLERVPKPEGGLVIGRADSGDNARVLESIRGTHSYLLGEDAGPAAQFTHVDGNRELVERINAQSPRDRFGYDRRNQLIFDATLPGAGRLTVLNPIRAAEVKEKIREYLTGSDLEMKKRVLDFLIQTPGARSRYAEETRALLANADPTIAARAELLHPGAEPDTARQLQAHISVLDDPATHNELATKLAQKVGEMARDNPALRTVLERNLLVTQPVAVNAVAQAYLRAGGTSPEAAPLMFTYLSVSDYPDYRAARTFLENLEVIPPALGERVEAHLQHLHELPERNRLTELAFEIAGRMTHLDGETVGAIERYFEVSGDRWEMARRANREQDLAASRLRMALPLLRPGTDEAARGAAMRGLALVSGLDFSRALDRLTPELRGRFLQSLFAELASPDPVRRREAAWMLPDMAYHYHKEMDAGVAVPRLLALLNDPSPEIVARASSASRYLAQDRPEVFPVLLEVLRRADGQSHSSAAYSYGELGGDPAALLAVVTGQVRHPDREVQRSAISALRYAGPVPAAVIFDLERALNGPNGDHLKLAVAHALAEVAKHADPQDARVQGSLARMLMALLRDNDSSTRNWAMAALPHLRMGYPGIVQEFQEARREYFYFDNYRYEGTARHLEQIPKQRLPPLPRETPPPRTLASASAPRRGGPLACVLNFFRLSGLRR